MTNKTSYVSASAMPWKLLQAKDAIVDGKIRPYHLQLIPTNRCNANCPWCSCKNVDRKPQLSLPELKEIAAFFYGLGSRAMTITGGGEPTIHPGIEEFVDYSRGLGYDLGLVTNGFVLARQKSVSPLNGKLVWLRMSITDVESGNYDANLVRKVAANLPDVDLGISFTVSRNVSLKTAREIAEVAEDLKNMTHVRYVEDIVNFAPEQMDRVQEVCGPISAKGIFQRRHEHEGGCNPCMISLLKPMVDALGYVYPCCGVQYAAGGEDQHLDMPREFRMCHWRDFASAKPFDGRVCKKCYYGDYNRLLLGLTQHLDHEKFL